MYSLRLTIYALLIRIPALIITILCIHMYKNIDYTPALCQTYLHTRSLHLSRSRGRREESSNRQTHRKLVIQIYLFFIFNGVHNVCYACVCCVHVPRGHTCVIRYVYIDKVRRCACVRACARMCMCRDVVQRDTHIYARMDHR